MLRITYIVWDSIQILIGIWEMRTLILEQIPDVLSYRITNGIYKSYSWVSRFSSIGIYFGFQCTQTLHLPSIYPDEGPYTPFQRVLRALVYYIELGPFDIFVDVQMRGP